MNIPYQKYHLSGSDLKNIALVTMAIDHFAASDLLFAIFNVLPLSSINNHLMLIYELMRTIGRIAFPIYCFLLVEGFFHTSSRKKYALRLFFFALISEIPFNLAFQRSLFDSSYQNVFFTLLIGFLVLWMIDSFKKTTFFILPSIVVFLAGCYLAEWLHTDYGFHGIILITIFYLFHDYKTARTVIGCLSLLWEAPACLAFIPIHFYDGRKGKSLNKYFFYAFYPLHLLLYVLLSRVLEMM